MAESFSDAVQSVQSAIEEFGSKIGVLTSFQREGVVICDLVLGLMPTARIVTIDTGRLPEASQKMIAQVESHFGIVVERVRPDEDEVSAMVSTHGAELFHKDVPYRMLCCEVRKVRPLAKLSRSLEAVFVGLRREQSAVRSEIPVIERGSDLIRVSPLAGWSREDVLQYSKERNLPEHPLYQLGYSTIGCDPCTRAIGAGEDERAGRWWWESNAAKECGLHFSADGGAVRLVDFLVEDLVRQVAAK